MDSSRGIIHLADQWIVDCRVDGVRLPAWTTGATNIGLHLISYHLVWTSKRRKALLVGEIERECLALIEQVCRDAGWEIHQLVVRPDHVYLIRARIDTAAGDVQCTLDLNGLPGCCSRLMESVKFISLVLTTLFLLNGCLNATSGQS
jgi:hypothetical protein